MRQFILVILFVQCLTNFCAGELSTEKKDLYLNGFIDYLNSLPNQAFAYEDGVILNAEESVSRHLDFSKFSIVSSLNIL